MRPRLSCSAGKPFHVKSIAPYRWPRSRCSCRGLPLWCTVCHPYCVPSKGSCVVLYGTWAFSRDLLFLCQYFRPSLGRFKEPLRTSCLHRFCKECIVLAMKSSRRCPLCNTTITKRGLTTSVMYDELSATFGEFVKVFEATSGLGRNSSVCVCLNY